MLEMTPFRKGNNDIARGDDYFNQFFRNFFGDNFAGFMEMNRSPFRVDIRESNDAYLIEAELPGVNKEDINVEYNNNYLTLSAKREDKATNVADNFVRRERYFGELKRSFYVDDIDENKIEASFKEGILRITLYKQSKGTQRKRIDIH